MKILSTQAMREVEKRAIEELGIPGIVLMENAALAVAVAALRQVPGAESAIVFCGPGNNGGDGLAVARQLVARGLRVVAVVAAGGREFSGDARAQLGIAERMNGTALELRTLSPGGAVGDLLAELPDADLVIDALFGTGLSRPLAGQFADLAAAINSLAGPTISVDLPSGLDGDRSKVPGPHVEAELTVTFAALKTAHVFSPAAEASGRVVVSDLGIPGELVDQVEGNLFLLESGEVAPLLAPRPRAAHKGDFGHLLIVAGSSGKSGAAVLAARAAVRSGAGLVTAAVPVAILSVLEAAAIEAMAVALPCSERGELSGDAKGLLEQQQIGKHAVAMGPGLGSSPVTFEVVRAVSLSTALPLVLDADGLNAFAGRLGELAGRAGPTVLTPHPGELGRLLGVPTSDVVANRLGLVQRAAREASAVVVLKGHLSLVADSKGNVFANPTGNPGMATGGTGDVLTGIIGALLAQGLDALGAAQFGVFVHGLAGDRGAAQVGELSLAAGDLIENLPGAFEELSGSKSRVSPAEDGS